MNTLTYELTIGRPKPKDYEALSDGMLLYHAKQGHTRKSEVISIFIKDKYKKVRGGIIVTILWNGMEIHSLWAEESLRRKGYGKTLLTTAEQKAKEIGCTFAYTNTFSWQAPEFYKKLGYTPFGTLKNFPPGNTLTYLWKKL